MIQSQYDNKTGDFYVKVPVDNQELYMAFEEYASTFDTIYFNIYLNIYNKRGQMADNLAHTKITSNNPFATAATAIKSFNILEKACLSRYNKDYNVVIFCYWIDNRRRDAYYKYLSKKGYRYGRIPYDNSKCIIKKYKKGDYNE